MYAQPSLKILNRRVELGDPHVISDSRDLLGIRDAIYEPLVRLNGGGEPVPVLAVDWSCDDDARTWTLRLRRGVSFHDGSVLEAEDVVATLQRVTNNEIGGEMASQGVYQSYLAGASFAALNQETLQITLAEPLADLPDLLAKIAIVPQSFAQGDESLPIGTGPYRVTDARAGSL